MQLNRRSIIVLSLVLVAVWSAWCFLLLPEGLDFTDEGLYCSEAWRLAQGDTPFLDSLGVSGLSFWYLSWVLHVIPDCGLLGLRVVWAITMLLCASVTAALLLRRFSPTISFAGAAIGLFFATSGTIKVLSYNTMPVLWLLIAVWLWLSACRQGGKPQLALAGGAGIAAFMATTCRISLLPIALLPAATIVYDYVCGVKMEGRLRSIIAFLATYTGGVACFVLAVFIAGLSGAFSSSLAATMSLITHSTSAMIFNFRDSTLYYVLPAIPILHVFLVARIGNIAALVERHKRTFLYVVVPIMVLCVVIAALNWDAILKIAAWHKRDVLALSLNPFVPPVGRSHLFLFALAIGLVLGSTIFHIFSSHLRGEKAESHNMHRLGFVALFLSFLMMPGTANLPARSNVALLLPLAMAFCLSWSWVLELKNGVTGTGIRWLARVALAFLSLVYLFYGIVPSCYPYRDSYVGELTGQASATKLRGITTTGERAHTVDELIEAVKSNSQPGDRILAYENMPMLYFLTDRLPSTQTTWLTETFPASLRQHVLDDMIKRDRLPTVVVRATYTTEGPCWPVVQHPLHWKDGEQEIDPVDRYIREHYKVIDEVDGFQIMVKRD